MSLLSYSVFFRLDRRYAVLPNVIIWLTWSVLGSICCGPTWVRSIKDGELDLDYDGTHMFSRLNAVCVRWLSQGSGTKTKLYSDTWPCGQSIITKCVGSDLCEDITRSYKYELGMDQTLYLDSQKYEMLIIQNINKIILFIVRIPCFKVKLLRTDLVFGKEPYTKGF